MLRHYDAIGLLGPARIDPDTGYRYYEADQLRRLNRVIALKELGLGLEQVAAILDDKVGIEELRGMLRLRQAQIEEEGYMTTEEVVLKRVGAARVAELSALAASYDGEAIGPVIGPLYDEMFRRLGMAGVHPAGAQPAD
jgi:DNA-binding transcriptional MerR regulator